MKKTPLFEKHTQLGARMIDFGGWMMPVQYSKILTEHRMVRESAGLFDVSHMGEIFIEGPEALEFADYLVTNNLLDMVYGDVIYSPMCYENGGCVDDILIYCFGSLKVMLAVNASNIEKDYQWVLEKSQKFDVKVFNKSNEYSQIAIQGPKAQEILQKITSVDLNEIKFFKFKDDIKITDKKVLVSRTGYTGEDGFEIYAGDTDAEYLFEAVLNAGGEMITPCGLGARDTLRMESCLPLYGHELSSAITPVQAGLGYFIKITDKPFVGKKAISQEKASGPAKISVGFEMLGRGIPRNEYRIFNEENIEIGVVTSGSFCPTLEKNMGLALVDFAYSKSGTKIYIGIRNKMVEAVTVKKPFYKKKYKK